MSLNVTVTDQSRNFVTSTSIATTSSSSRTASSRTLTYFTKAQLPIALSLLIDTSASMEDKLRLAQEAAIGFVRRLRPDDMAQVIDFDNRVIDPAAVHRATGRRSKTAIRQTVPNGSTSLHNAIYISLKELKKVRAKSTERRAAPGDRRAVGRRGHVEPRAVRGSARPGQALRGGHLHDRDPRPRLRRRAASPKPSSCCKQFAQETGGRAFFPTGATELDVIYAQIADELAAQYALAYSSRNPRRDGQWRRIVVRTTKPELVARTKQGYFGPVN